MDEPAAPHSVVRSWVAARFLVLLVIFAILYVYPICTAAIRLGIAADLAALCASGVALLWRQKTARSAALGGAALCVAAFALPGQPARSEALRAEYVQALTIYEGTRYVWGGENPRGIDCSGLIRAGMVDANLRLGLRTLNPGLLRASISLWWHDCSARELGDGYAGRTRPITATPSINALNHALLRPGDIAVTESGVHTLAYLGDREWIEADPAEGVIRVTVPASNPWFGMPVRVLRWKDLE